MDKHRAACVDLFFLHAITCGRHLPSLGAKVMYLAFPVIMLLHLHCYELDLRNPEL
jgi:hypothetical protein